MRRRKQPSKRGSKRRIAQRRDTKRRDTKPRASRRRSSKRPWVLRHECGRERGYTFEKGRWATLSIGMLEEPKKRKVNAHLRHIKEDGRPPRVRDEPGNTFKKTGRPKRGWQLCVLEKFDARVFLSIRKYVIEVVGALSGDSPSGEQKIRDQFDKLTRRRRRYKK